MDRWQWTLALDNPVKKAADPTVAPLASHTPKAIPSHRSEINVRWPIAKRGQAAKVPDAMLQGPLPQPEPSIRCALASAMMTPDAALSPEQLQWMAVLLR